MSDIYDKYRGRLDDNQIKNIVLDSLRSLTFDDGRSYYFVMAMDGTALLYPPTLTWKEKAFFMARTVTARKLSRT